MKVALVQCPVWGTREPPLAIVQLAGCLKAKGHRCRSFDLNNHLYKTRTESFSNLWAWEQSQFWYHREDVDRFFAEIAPALDAFAQRILDDQPDLVGFSVAASSYPATIAFAKLLKAKQPSLRILFGGPVYYNRSYIEQSFAESPVDFAVAGEADVTVPALATALDRGIDIASCPGIYYRDGAVIRHSGERPLLENLDELSFMDFTDLRIQDYDDTVHLFLMSSRGCAWNCAFCSSRSFWKGYRAMSAERVHQEIVFHCSTNRAIGHIDFADLMINGSVKRVEELSELLIRYPANPYHPVLRWVANAIIHPGLTPDVLRKMADAGCKKLIFGIESGSQRVLGLMKKKYRIEDARRVIQDAAEAGIGVTCNFMFGFPGETEDDFAETLDFIRQTGRYMERVYPSRTYCAMEEFSYIFDHPHEYGIKTPFNHHLYWETVDGANTYPVRLKRCQRFEQACHELGVQVDCGVRTAVELDEWFNLGHYYEYRQEFDKALEYFMKYEKSDPKNEVVAHKIHEIYERCPDLRPAGIP